MEKGGLVVISYLLNMEKKKPEKKLSDKERAVLILKGEIAHWRHLEKGLGADKSLIAKKIGAIRFVMGLVEKL
jgi:hypothetical protein